MNITIEIAAQFTGTLTIKDVCTIEVTPPRLSNSEIAAKYTSRISDEVAASKGLY